MSLLGDVAAEITEQRVKDIALVNVNKMVLLGNTIHFECKQNALTITPNFPEYNGVSVLQKDCRRYMFGELRY